MQPPRPRGAAAVEENTSLTRALTRCGSIHQARPLPPPPPEPEAQLPPPLPQVLDLLEPGLLRGGTPPTEFNVAAAFSAISRLPYDAHSVQSDPRLAALFGHAAQLLTLRRFNARALSMAVHACGCRGLRLPPPFAALTWTYGGHFLRRTAAQAAAGRRATSSCFKPQAGRAGGAHSAPGRQPAARRPQPAARNHHPVAGALQPGLGPRHAARGAAAAVAGRLLGRHPAAVAAVHHPGRRPATPACGAHSWRGASPDTPSGGAGAVQHAVGGSQDAHLAAAARVAARLLRRLVAAPGRLLHAGTRLPGPSALRAVWAPSCRGVLRASGAGQHAVGRRLAGGTAAGAVAGRLLGVRHPSPSAVRPARPARAAAGGGHAAAAAALAAVAQAAGGAGAAGAQG